MRYWITYFISVFAIAALQGYLIALCPCNTDIGTGMLFALLTWLLLAAVVLLHYHLLRGTRLIPAFIRAVLVTILTGGFIFFMEQPVSRAVRLPYFYEWFIVCSVTGLVNGLGIWLTKQKAHEKSDAANA